MVNDNTKMHRSNFIFMIVLFAAACLCVVAVMYGVDRHEQILREDQARINQLAMDLDAQALENSRIDDRVALSATGMNADRVETDKRLIDRMLENVFTWGSWVQYEEARQLLLNQYHIDPDSYLMKTLFAEVPYVETWNEIDYKGINCSYESSSVYLRQVAVDAYNYLVLVTYSSRSRDFAYEGFGRVLLDVTVRDDGMFENTMAWALD